ncbi:hypothetical protein FB45DRAFT_933565 [Roridomyces roridus]|uniref:Protein kinase domain-containing protein n=1 Tax=Roridomyces roridus TaxID=1738132 RepID=A0AAD7FFE8_9AGAR|nr:hypothetical protein FB45DRAFT_933565 [Roridomyces roridus]
MEASSESQYESAIFTGAFFPQSRGLVISGGTFLSVTENRNHPPPNPDYHRFSIADVDLIREIRIDASSRVVARRTSPGTGLRRMYSATVNRTAHRMTVAMYQGRGSAEKWRKDVSLHSMFRHPNFVQIYGAASSTNIHAIIFNDNLVPFEQHLQLHEQSHFSTIYIFEWANRELRNAFECFTHVSGEKRLSVRDCTFWHRPATDRLCLNLTPKTRTWGPSPLHGSNKEAISSDVPREETEILDSLDLGHYLWLCYSHLAREHRLMMLRDGEFDLGSVIHWPAGSQLEEDAAPIAFCQGMRMTVLGNGWLPHGGKQAALGRPEHWQVMDISNPYPWIPQDYVSQSLYSADVYGRTISARLHNLGTYTGGTSISAPAAWLSRANEILDTLQIDSKLEDYVLLTEVHVLLDVGTPSHSASSPEGYLILCPPNALITPDSSKFRWPVLPYYWSRDPFGEQRLVVEEAEKLGFPAITCRGHVDGKSWDASVYEGVRRFIDMKAGSRELLENDKWPSFHLGIHRDKLKASGAEAHWADETFDSMDLRLTLESAYYFMTNGP